MVSGVEVEVDPESSWDLDLDPQRLRTARGSQSQRKCAEEISADGGGVSQQQVSAWEKGEDVPSAQNLPAARRYVARREGVPGTSATSRRGSTKVVPIRPGDSSVSPPTDLREAIATRIASGVPMNKWDIQAIALATGDPSR